MKKGYTQQDLHEALVKNPDLGSKAIAAIVGCTPGAVRQYAARHGLNYNKQQNANGKQPGRPKGSRDNPSKPCKRNAYGIRVKEEPKKIERPPMKAGMMGSGRVYASSYTRVL